MNFLKFLFLFAVGGFAIGFIFYQYFAAVVLLYGIVVVLVITVMQEIARMKSKQGRNQIKREQDYERYMEEYWGTIDDLDK